MTETTSDDRPMATVIAELRTLNVASLMERYEAAFGRPPRIKHREWLWRRIAWKVQEQRFGGLSTVAKRRLDELIAELDLPLGNNGTTVRGEVREGRGGSRRPTDPVLGTTLTRTWKGREIAATRVEGGWEHDGVVYRSLSAVAKAVTGSHWNGRLFFGLTKRKGAAK